MSRAARDLLAYLAAPRVGAAILVAYSLVHADNGVRRNESIVSTSIVAAALSYLWTAAVGVGAHGWLRRSAHTALRHYLASGFALGVLPLVIYAAFVAIGISVNGGGTLSVSGLNVVGLVEASAMLGTGGAAVALVFWRVAGREPVSRAPESSRRAEVTGT